MNANWVRVPFEVDKRFDGYRVDRFLAQRLTAYSRSRVQKILLAARVTRDECLLKPSSKVRSGEQIVIAYPKREEAPLAANVTIPILYEDDALIVVDKPANLLSHPTDKVVDHTVLGLLRHCRPDLKQLHLFHRLDRETSGVLALGKTLAAARAWTRLMTRREIQKIYLALVSGVPTPLTGVISWPIGRQGGKVRVRQWVNVPGAVKAVTKYEVIRRLTPQPLPRTTSGTSALKGIEEAQVSLTGEGESQDDPSPVRETRRFHNLL